MSGNDLLKKGLEELGKLGDEVEKVVKDAAVDVQEGWKKVQPHVEKAEKAAVKKGGELARELGETANTLYNDVRHKIDDLRNDNDGRQA